MNKKEIIKNIIIFDGETEFSSKQIASDPNLTSLRNSITHLGGFVSLIQEINDENGLLYITTDKSLQFGEGELKNVSPSLYDEYLKKKP